MRKIFLSLRWIALGIVLGEAFLILGILDCIRSNAMGTDAMPDVFSRPIGYVATDLPLRIIDIFPLPELHNHDAIGLFIRLIVFWAIFGAVSMLVFLRLIKLYRLRAHYDENNRSKEATN